MKTKKLNRVLARLTRQTESSGRKMNRDASGDMYGFQQTQTFHKPYTEIKEVRRTK